MRIIADRSIAGAESFLIDCGDVELMWASEMTASSVRDADVLLVRSRTRINAELLRDSKVQFVGSCVSGVDHVDQAWLKEAGITFAHAHGCNARSVAEYVATVIMHYACKNKRSFGDLSVGIVGVGAVGTCLVEILETLAIKVYLYDPPRAVTEKNRFLSDLKPVMQSEIISLHVPLSLQGRHPTKHLIGNDFLRNCTAQCLINTARGEVVDEGALLNSSLHFFALDCWQKEPNINPQLVQRSGLATPHIAGHSWKAKIAGTKIVVEQLKNYLKKPIQQSVGDQLSKSISLDLTKFSNFEGAVMAFAKACYDPFTDCLKDEKLEVVTAFEEHRNNYPKRFEWSECSVQLSGVKGTGWFKHFESWLLNNKVTMLSWNKSRLSFINTSVRHGKIWEKGGC